MNIQKQKIVLDFDDTMVKSSEQIIRMLNKKYGLNKTIEDLKDWSYSSIYPKITNAEIQELYSSIEFFNQVEWNIGVQEFLIKFNNEYEFIICSKGSKQNLFLKELFLNQHMSKMHIQDWTFIGLELNDETNCELNKSCIDFSNCIFAIDDNTNALLSINVPKKILIKNYADYYWNEIPTNQEDLYVVNTFDDLTEMCEFDIKLRNEGIYIG